MKNKASIIALVLFTITIIMSFAELQNTKFYYAYNNKIFLNELENKLIVRYKQNKKSDIKQISLNSELAKMPILWKDDSTCIITFGLSEKDFYKDRIMMQPDVKSCNPVYVINTGLEMGVTDEFVVQFNKDVSQKEIKTLHDKYGVQIVKETNSYLLLKVPSGGDALETANKYQESGLAYFSHPNFLCDIILDHVIPNDTYFGNQFYLHNTGQVFTDGHSGIPDADIDAPEAWSVSLGDTNIVIAVIDDGVTSNHPDLPNSRQRRFNGSNFGDGNLNNPSPTGDSNHGNACAGIIAATQGNNQGISGIAPNCRIMPIRIFNSGGTNISNQKVADAIDSAWIWGADIISNSWSYNSYDPNAIPIVKEAIVNATSQGRNGLGCVVVFAAGNTANHNISDNGHILFPGNVNVNGVLTVGASTRNDLQAIYSPTSNPASPYNQIIDIVAPSHRAYSYQDPNETLEVWTIDTPDELGYNPVKSTDGGTLPVVGSILPSTGNNFLSYTARMGGTSAACPQVAAVAALILSVNPDLSQEQVFDILTGTADHGTHYTYTNEISNEFGYGRLNAFNAVSQALSTVCTVSGSTLVCASPNKTFTLNNRPSGTTVRWYKSSNLVYISGYTTDSYTVKASTTKGLGWVRPTIYIGTDSVVLPQYTVWVGVPTNATGHHINYVNNYGLDPDTYCTEDSYAFYLHDDNIQYSNNFQNGLYTLYYDWIVDGSSKTTNSYTNTVFTGFTEKTTDLKVKMRNTCGSSRYYRYFYDIVGCSSRWGFSLSPNPTEDLVQIDFFETDLSGIKSPILEQAPSSCEFSIVLYDNLQRPLKTSKSFGERVTINVSDLMPGSYIVKVNNSKKQLSQVLIIN